MTDNFKELPEIQNTEPKIPLRINQVGVENVEVPFKLELKTGGFESMVANVSMRADLEPDIKGVSMSRFIRTLKNYLSQPLNHELCFNILQDLIDNLEVNETYMSFKFKMPISRKSIKSDNEFPMYHDCMFEAHLIRNEKNQEVRFFQGVRVQYASYCPCSAELCNHAGEGFPHAQRSFTNIIVEIDPSNDNKIWLEDIIHSVENAIHTLPYPIIKREDEQEIARIAANNPIFVEDAIRSISTQIDSMVGVKDWIVKCIHEESIHSSDAIAVNYKGIVGGFDHKYFL